MLCPHAYGAASARAARGSGVRRPDRVEVGGRATASLTTPIARCPARPRWSSNVSTSLGSHAIRRRTRRPHQRRIDAAGAERSGLSQLRDLEAGAGRDDRRTRAAQVTVNVRVDPALQRRSCAASLSGRQAGRRLSARTRLSYELKDVPRGTHSRGRRDHRSARHARSGDPAGDIHTCGRNRSRSRRSARRCGRRRSRSRVGAANKLPTSQPSYAALNGGAQPIDPRTNKPVRHEATPKGPKRRQLISRDSAPRASARRARHPRPSRRRVTDAMAAQPSHRLTRAPWRIRHAFSTASAPAC